jgi:DNA-binding IclR family transcriptional regulator
LLQHKGLNQYTENSIVDPDRYLEELERTRAQGYAIDREEYLKGVTAVAVLIYSGHFPIAAVWVVGFTTSMGDKKLPDIISHLKSTAEQISTRLSPFVSDKAAKEG